MATIEISDFRDQGVSLTPATDADFEARANAILAGKAEAVMELAPYLTIVANRNPRTVVAYTVAWAAVLRNGSTEFNYTQMKFPDAVAGVTNGLALLHGREMKMGDERLVGMGFEVWPLEYAASYREYGVQSAAALGGVSSLAIELDAVIFEDGTLLGPDRSQLAENFIEFVHAKQSLYRGDESRRCSLRGRATLRTGRSMWRRHSCLPRPDSSGRFSRGQPTSVTHLRQSRPRPLAHHRLERHPWHMRHLAH
jgi:hypothetical protein